MGHQLSKPGRESSTSHTAKLSQEDIAKLLSASPFQPEDYMIKDVDDQKNQAHEDSQQMTEDQIEYVKRSVGRIIAKYPKKLRKTLKGLQSTKEIITNGTASFIDNNLLITAAHNIFLREYNQMASEVYFLPEKLNNSQSGAVDLTPAQKYAVFEEYSNPQNEYTQKFDIALVVLQDHKFSNQTACLDIEWSYKRWEHLSPSLNLFGYPENLKNKKTKINEMKHEKKFIIQQDEMVCYSNTCGGESGGPLVKLSNSDTGSKVKLVGVHRGVRGNNSVGLTLNSSQNTQEIIYQLAEKLQVEGRMKAYEFSCKKMREFMKKEKNVTEKLKQFNKLQEENSRQKEEIKRLNSTIDQLKTQINTLNESIKKMKAEQQKIMTQTTKNEAIKIIQTSQKQIEQKLYELLYKHIERTISKGEWLYGLRSQKYYKKAVSKKEVEEETAKYLNYLKSNIEPLPPQYQQQLSFLIDLFNSQNKCIINWYHIHSNQKNSTGPAKFYLNFGEIKQRIDLKQLLSFNNWNHVAFLSVYECGWFNDDDWKALVEHAANFKNLEELDLDDNKISAIKEGDIEQFKSLELISLSKLLIKTIDGNPLNGQSKQVLKNIKQKNNNKIEIEYDK